MIKINKEFKTPDGEVFAIELEIDGKIIMIRHLDGHLEIVLEPIQWRTAEFVKASELA